MLSDDLGWQCISPLHMVQAIASFPECILSLPKHDQNDRSLDFSISAERNALHYRHISAVDLQWHCLSSWRELGVQAGCVQLSCRSLSWTRLSGRAGLGTTPEKWRLSLAAEFMVRKKRVQLKSQKFYLQALKWIEGGCDSGLITDYEMTGVWELICLWRTCIPEIASDSMSSLQMLVRLSLQAGIVKNVTPWYTACVWSLYLRPWRLRKMTCLQICTFSWASAPYSRHLYCIWL